MSDWVECTKEEEVGRDAWRAWRATLVDFGVKEIVLSIEPVKDRVKEDDVVAAMVEPTARDISEGCSAIAADIRDECVAFDLSRAWGIYSDHENFSILGASPDWLRRFNLKFGDIRMLRRGFEDCLDYQLGDDEPESPRDRYIASIKRSVRWPEA